MFPVYLRIWKKEFEHTMYMTWGECFQFHVLCVSEVLAVSMLSNYDDNESMYVIEIVTSN